MARRFKAGDVIFRGGTRTGGLYEVVSGKVKLVRTDPSGQETILYVANAGDTLGEGALFAEQHACDAVALTDAVVRLYPKAILLNEIERSPEVAQGFMSMLAQEIMVLRTRLQQRNIASAHERIRHYLSLNVGADGRTVTLPGNTKDFATYLGLSEDTLAETLAEMVAAGEIERYDGKVRLRATA
jgi:CRP-like cAMP-binding protein